MNKTALQVLNGVAGVLVVDSDPVYHDLYTRIFSGCPIYAPRIVSNNTEARAVLAGARKIHLIITELESQPGEGDEFGLLREYAECLPCVVVSSRDSLEKGFKAGSYNALAIDIKPLTDGPAFLRLISELFLNSLLTPGYTVVESDYLKHYISVFKRFHPSSAEDWAERAGLPLPFLNRNWIRQFNTAPAALTVIHALARAALRECLPATEWPVPGQDEVDRCLAQFVKNEAEYRQLLTVGNLVPRV